PRRAARSARQPPPKRLPLRSRSDCALPPEPCWSQLEASWRKCAMTVPVADFYAAFTAPNEEGRDDDRGKRNARDWPALRPEHDRAIGGIARGRVSGRRRDRTAGQLPRSAARLFT